MCIRDRGLNAFVLKRLLVQFAPFPGLFLTAALIAFLLDLPCRWLAQRGLPRAWAIVSVVLVTLGLLVWAAVALVPLLIEQLSQLLSASPSLLTAAEQWIDRGQLWALDHGLPADFADLSSDLVAQFSRLATQLSQRLLGLLGATVGTTINVVIVLVLAVFLLFGADPIVDGLARWLPDRWRDLVQTTLERTFRGYFAGQVVLALILSGGQLLVFTALNIPYGVLFAVLIGFTTLVPYASAVSIVSVSAVLAVQDPRTGLELLAAAIVVVPVRISLLSLLLRNLLSHAAHRFDAADPTLFVQFDGIALVSVPRQGTRQSNVGDPVHQRNTGFCSHGGRRWQSCPSALCRQCSPVLPL